MPEAKFHDCKNFPEPAMKFCVQLSDSEKADKIKAVVENCDANWQNILTSASITGGIEMPDDEADVKIF